MFIRLTRPITLGIAVASLAMVAACGPAQGEPDAAPQQPASGLQWSSPPSMQLGSSTSYQAVFTTEAGEFTVELFADRVPVTVNNFVFLARQGYYDTTTFHRVLPGFMAQGGDPTGTGNGGPGYTFDDEFHPELRFDRAGLLGMANRGPNTNGSQFFITFAPTPHLNGLHTIFGELVDGAEVLDSLTPRDPLANPDYFGDELLSVEIVEAER